ncbi:hypothetical protein AB0424_09605 [Streptomyces sp. NPDC051180]|uniref:hypothetical protein n=1 Tax=Streptomyces sp. NPDC051180 TaxID=3155797 RepID=UPI00344FC834
MHEASILASRWDLPVDVGRLLWAVIFGHLPTWARYTVLAVFLTLLTHALLGWLRDRSGATPDDDAPVREGDAPAQDDDAPAQDDDTAVHESGAGVR